MLHGHGDILTNAQSARGAIVTAPISVLTGYTDIRRRRLLRGNGGRGLEFLHGEVTRAKMTRRAVRGHMGAALAGPGAGLVAIGAALGAAAPALEGGEDVAEEGPDEGQVGDEDGDEGFAEVPVHVDVGDQGLDETVDLVEDGGDNDEDAHAEEDHQDQLLLERDAHLHEHRDGDEEHEDIGGDGDAALDDFIVLVGRALVVVGWNGPVLGDGATDQEE